MKPMILANMPKDHEIYDIARQLLDVESEIWQRMKPEIEVLVKMYEDQAP